MNIKRILILIMVISLSLSFLAACTKPAQTENGESGETALEYYNVTFKTNCDAEIAPRKVIKGEKLGEPDTPEKEGYVFDGWYNGKLKWNFLFDSVKGDLILEAVWLKPEDVFAHEPVGDGTTVITKVKKETPYLTIPSTLGGYTVTTIGEGVFEKAVAETYTKITIPKTVTTILDSAFMDCKDVEIEIQGALKYVGEWAFDGCTGLKRVTFDENVEKIGAEAFASSGLTEIVIPKSVKQIEENAFESCGSLEKVFLYAADITILDSAFLDAGVKAVYFYGTEAEIDDFFESRLEPKNDKLLNANILIYSETKPTSGTKYDGYWYFDGNGQTRMWS